VRKSLIAKNKLGFIDDSLTISSPLVNSPTTAQAWIHADNMVGTWIINSISPKLQGSFVTLQTQKDPKRERRTIKRENVGVLALLGESMET